MNSELILVPSGTVVSAKGDGPTVDVSGTSNRVFLVTLSITKIIEQESLDVSIFGSADGSAWEPKSLAAFRQEFYCGEFPLLLDLRRTRVLNSSALIGKSPAGDAEPKRPCSNSASP